MSLNLKTASVLAFERKIDPSDALFFAGAWEERHKSKDWEPVTIREKSVRGTISNRLKTNGQDPSKLDAQIENPNPQKVDVAALPLGTDTLKVKFSLRILGGLGIPSACNNAEYQKKIIKTVENYLATEGFSELAKRYSFNLANGRFLWRNRVGAENVEVNISSMINGIKENSWSFDAFSLSLRNFEPNPNSLTSLENISKLIADGLSNIRQHVLLDVTAFVRLGERQEVFPSQELILGRVRGSKSRTLYQMHGIAGIHSQKIGNAIRTIDTWYPEANVMGPIAIEPYGSVTTQGKAYRQPKEKIDFYTLLDNWIIKDIEPSSENQHYVIAVLIRGGVFGEKGD